MKGTVSVAQVELRDGDIAGNLSRANQVVADASRRGSDLVLLPELWLQGYALGQADRLALGPADARWEALEFLASGASCTVAGGVMAQEAGTVRNRLVVHSKDGTLLAHYDKVHLFGQIQEDRYLAAGNALVVADLGWCRAGLAICYDLRFPELFRSLVRVGAEVILLAAQWPQARIEHWRTLVRARAIENQVYMVACNRTGASEQLQYGGCSLIVDPWGDTIQEAGETPTLLTAELDMAHVHDVRGKFPVWQDVRPEVYEGYSLPGATTPA